ncbi:MAG: Ig-like domain-containing protein, partial [Crocinitomicaceae bacterium]
MVLKSVLQMFCLIFLFVSCYKVEPTTLEVTVKDNTGNVIPNAIVYVEGEPTVSPSPSIEAIYESETNSNGVVQFELGNI